MEYSSFLGCWAIPTYKPVSTIPYLVPDTEAEDAGSFVIDSPNEVTSYNNIPSNRCVNL
jgi:hypothetical protein